MVVSLAPPPQLWLPPEISFLRIASNANLGGTSGRALFPLGRFCQNIFSASITFASNANFSIELQRSPYCDGQALVLPFFCITDPIPLHKRCQFRSGLGSFNITSSTTATNGSFTSISSSSRRKFAWYDDQIKGLP